MEKEITGVKFKDIYPNKKVRKEYFLKKINLAKYPTIKKNLKIFFNDYNKYFQTTYEDKYIIVGKKNKIDKIKLLNPFSENINQKKIKSKKYIKRMTLKKALTLKSSKDGSNTPNQKANKTEEKKKNFTISEENALKQGQRFIEDKEVDTLFDLFKEVRRINKNRIDKFVTLKELIEKNKNIPFSFHKTTRNFNKKNYINLKTENNKKILYSVDKKNKKEMKMNNENSISNKDIIIDKDNLINDNDYYKTTSTRFTGSFRDELNNKNGLFSTKSNESNNNSNYKLKTLIPKEIKERKRLIKSQEQYISQEIGETLKNKFACILSLQENTLLLNNNIKNMQAHINNYLSSKLKNSKKKILLLQDDNYRSKLETRIKLSNLYKKLNPDKLYNWYKDLHCSENFFKSYENLPDVETIRNPQNIKFSTPKNKLLEKNEYLEKTFPKRVLIKIAKDFKNAQNNFDTLCVNGVNLLKFENDIFKKLKGRKIINDFERLMTPKEIKSRNIYTKIDNKAFSQKTKSYKIIDTI